VGAALLFLSSPATAQLAQQHAQQAPATGAEASASLTPVDITGLQNLNAATSRSIEGLTFEHRADGTVGLNLEGRFQNIVRSTIGPDGRLALSCAVEAHGHAGTLPKWTPSRTNQLQQSSGISPQLAEASGRIIVDFYVLPDAPTSGFGDPAPAPPVPGNPGLTIGQQRIFVFLRAAEIWTEILKPERNIFVAAIFMPLGPGVLGAAGANSIWANFPGAELPNTWYYDSLADNLYEGDLGPGSYDIIAAFSTQFPFYLGYDNNEPAGTVDLMPVVLHEIGHGLNFANAVTEATGVIPIPDGQTGPYGDIYSQYTIDVTTNKTWNQMTNAERQASAINVRNVSWNGLHTNLARHRVLDRGEPAVRLTTPTGTSLLMLGTASFGPGLTATGVSGQVVAALDAADAAGPTTTDGCSPILNNVSGFIALIDRGTCGFVEKVHHAQAAGAIAVLIGDNVLALPPADLGGADPAIVIPSGRIGLPDATDIRTRLAAGEIVRARLHKDMTVVAGTDRAQRKVMLAAFNPVAPGSSISHFEAVASPNQIMEPAINADLVSSLAPPADLTLSLLTDLGWFTDRDGVLDGRDACLRSNTAPTVVLGTCDSMVPNAVHESGCTVSDLLNVCGGLSGRTYQFCIALASTALRAGGLINGPQQSAINRCVR
jgi:hypothetical protein